MVPENNTPSVVATSDRPSVAWSSVVLSTLTLYQNTGHCRLRYYPPRARPNVCVKGKGISRDSREFIINASVSRDSTDMASPTAPVDGQKCSRPLHTVRFARSFTFSVGHRLSILSVFARIHLLLHRILRKRYDQQSSPQSLPLPPLLHPPSASIRLHRLSAEHLARDHSIKGTPLQSVWLKQQVRPCPCKMDTRITIITHHM